MNAASATATLALALGLGALIWLGSQRLRIPALIPLMLAGVALGRHGLGVVDPGLLGESLHALIALSVAVLVFEGSLHLDQETLGHAPRAVRGLLTVGALVTWAGISGAAMLLLGLPAPFAIVLGAILIVTGPTVIQPLLQRVRLTPRLHASLLTEGILIDPIGVIAAVATLEIVLVSVEARPAPGTASMLWAYVAPFVAGGAIGAAAGLATRWLLARTSGLGHHGERTSSMLAISASIVAAGASELVWHESGLVATAVAGLIIARSLRRQLQPARRAAESLAAGLVGLLFILLAADFDLPALLRLGWRDVAFLIVVVLAIRPLAVLASTWNSKLERGERAYLALMAPRGIVAVSAAALVASSLAGAPTAEARGAAEVIQRATLLVVVATVLWAGLAGGPLAGILGVRGRSGSGILIAGANKLARELAAALRQREIPARMVDTNYSNCAAAREAGLDVWAGDATDTDWLAHEALGPEHGAMISVTGNPDVDRVVARFGASVFGPARSASLGEIESGPLEGLPAQRLRAKIGSTLSAPAVLESVDAGQLRVEAAPIEVGVPIPLVVLRDNRVESVGALVAEKGDTVIGLRAAGAPATPPAEAPGAGGGARAGAVRAG